MKVLVVNHCMACQAMASLHNTPRPSADQNKLPEHASLIVTWPTVPKVCQITGLFLSCSEMQWNLCICRQFLVAVHWESPMEFVDQSMTCMSLAVCFNSHCHRCFQEDGR